MNYYVIRRTAGHTTHYYEYMDNRKKPTVYINHAVIFDADADQSLLELLKNGFGGEIVPVTIVEGGE